LAGVGLAEALIDQAQGFLGGFVGNAGGVRAHVGDQAHGFTGSQVDSFIELLGHHHGLFGRKAQFADGLLLEFAGDEGGQGVAAGGSFDDFVDHEPRRLQVV
jgi:hypothetical protein